MFRSNPEGSSVHRSLGSERILETPSSLCSSLPSKQQPNYLPTFITSLKRELFQKGEYTQSLPTIILKGQSSLFSQTRFFLPFLGRGKGTTLRGLFELCDGHRSRFAIRASRDTTPILREWWGQRSRSHGRDRFGGWWVLPKWCKHTKWFESHDVYTPRLFWPSLHTPRCLSFFEKIVGVKGEILHKLYRRKFQSGFSYACLENETFGYVLVGKAVTQ